MFNVIPLINKRPEAFSNPRIFLTNRGGVMNNIKPYFLTTSLQKAKAAVLFQDILGKGLEYAVRAKELNKPIVVVQHGRSGVVDYLPPKNQTMLSDKICVWGTRDYEMMLEAGFSKERIILTGSPIFEGMIPKRVPHKGINVLFAPAHPPQENKELQANLEIMEMLRSINGVNIIPKILSVHVRSNYGRNAIVSNAFDNDHLTKCVKAVEIADVLVSNQMGTIELIAMYFDIPVIFIDNRAVGRNRPAHQKNLGSYYINDVNDLPYALDLNLKQPGLMSKQRKEELLAAAGVGLPGSPTLKIVETIKGLVK